MNERNYEYLADQVKMTGFGETLQDALKEQMAKGEPDFQLQHQISHNEKEMNYTLNFRKSTTQDNYFFNSYAATLTRPGETDISNTFYTDQRITGKEAFNLLEGRSVEKKYNHHEKIVEDGKDIYKPIKDSTYNVWVKLDFNDADAKGNFKLATYGEKYGFDLEQKIAELPIKQLDNADDKRDLLNSLRKGNVQSVIFEKDGQKETRFVEANPRAREINVYDANMQYIADKKLAKDLGVEKPDGNEQAKEQKETKKKTEANTQSTDTKKKSRRIKA
jgi:hypothetical protein